MKVVRNIAGTAAKFENEIKNFLPCNKGRNVVYQLTLAQVSTLLTRSSGLDREWKNSFEDVEWFPSFAVLQ